MTTVIKNARLEGGISDILIENGKFLAVEQGLYADNVIDAYGKAVIPGLVDTHIHGFGGYDVSDGRLCDISLSLAKVGTTCWLPTTMTDCIENLVAITNQKLPTEGAEIAGFHLEGPYISPKRKGAQNEAYIKAPDISEYKQLKNVIKITVAPEIYGMCDFISKVDCQVSIGHTDCSYEEAIAAIEAGANCLTHTFNAMPPLLHRAPGPIGAAVLRGIYAEVICDGRHVSEAAFLSLYKMFGPERLMLVSDTIRPAGLPNGKYVSGGLTVFMKDGALTLEDGILAGGSQPLLQCVKKAVEFGVPFYDAVKMATETPAKSLGLNKGQIRQGFDADLIILNDDFSVDKVIIAGKEIKALGIS